MNVLNRYIMHLIKTVLHLDGCLAQNLWTKLLLLRLTWKIHKTLLQQLLITYIIVVIQLNLITKAMKAVTSNGRWCIQAHGTFPTLTGNKLPRTEFTLLAF